jgi:hypothetical protein
MPDKVRGLGTHPNVDVSMRWHKRFEGGVPWRRGASGGRWLLWLPPAARRKEGGGEAQWNQREMADKHVSPERGGGGYQWR